MQKAMLCYLVQSFILGLILTLGYFVFCKFGYPEFYTLHVFLITGLLFFVNGSVHSWLIYTAYKKNKVFNQIFLASVMVKLLIYLGILVVFIFIHPPLIKVILVAFLLLYFAFTSHEVYSISQFLKKKVSGGAKSN